MGFELDAVRYEEMLLIRANRKKVQRARQERHKINAACHRAEFLLELQTKFKRQTENIVT